MKQILIPTDYSDCSVAAVHYAINFAKDLGGAEIHFLNCLDVSDWISKESTSADNKYVNLLDKLELQIDQLDKFIDRFNLGDLSFKRSFKRGKPAETIVAFSNEIDASYIVMGTHGRSGIVEDYIGSVTQRVLRHASCPVLAIKENPTKAKSNKIVFLSDFAEDNKPIFEKCARLAEAMKSEIHLLNIDTPGYFSELSFVISENMEEFGKAFNGKKKYVRIHAWNVERGLAKYLKQEDIDLVVIPTHGRSGFLNSLRYSLAELIVNHLNVPIITYKIGQ